MTRIELFVDGPVPGWRAVRPESVRVGTVTMFQSPAVNFSRPAAVLVALAERAPDITYFRCLRRLPGWLVDVPVWTVGGPAETGTVLPGSVVETTLESSQLATGSGPV